MEVLNKLILGELSVSQVLYYVITNCKDSLDKEFVKWAEQEANGYENPCDLPSYRYVDCEVYVRYIDNFGNKHDEGVDVSEIDDYLIKNGGENALVSKMRISQGIESIEKSISDNKGGGLVMSIPPAMSKMLKQFFHAPAGCNSFSVYQMCQVEQGINIISKVKSMIIDNIKGLNFDDIEGKNAIEDNKKNTPLVFISHSSKDKEIVKLFVDNILKKGLALKDENIIFTSYEATGITPGDNIPNYIKTHIKDANIVLAMISDNYKASEVCMNEVGAAWALDKVPVQVLLPNAKIESLGWLINLDKAARLDDNESLDSLEEVICEQMKISIPTAKHWNPCTRDFLEALGNIPDLYDEEEPEISVIGLDGSAEIVCVPQYARINYCLEQNKKSDLICEGNLGVAVAMRGLTPELISSWVKSKEVATSVIPRIVYREINQSKVKVSLCLRNNRNHAIENGNLIISPNLEIVSFSESNVTEKSSISFRMPNTFQRVSRNMVEESFPKPINPSAVETLYDFYLYAPHDIGEFLLNWKLESLDKPKFGSIKIVWKPEYIDKWISLKDGDSRIGTSEINDYIVDETK
ncbi:MAG: TIR domain-containing protein [Prevotellaceae bacterium]|nr:TIR domain-containing protein [Candidatus Faecinaster equi]